MNYIHDMIRSDSEEYKLIPTQYLKAEVKCYYEANIWNTHYRLFLMEANGKFVVFNVDTFHGIKSTPEFDTFREGIESFKRIKHEITWKMDDYTKKAKEKMTKELMDEFQEEFMRQAKPCNHHSHH